MAAQSFCNDIPVPAQARDAILNNEYQRIIDPDLPPAAASVACGSVE
jgi:hypothetical protein